jgi:predicted TIM-barrel fold metal-dependent hydrolase
MLHIIITRFFPMVLFFTLLACGGGHKKHNNDGVDAYGYFSPDMNVVEKWKHLQVIDVHNHEACCFNDSQHVNLANQYYIHKTVLFGNISDPEGLQTDALSWEAYKKHPDKIIPFFAAFEIDDPKGIERVAENLEKGYFGVGEIVAASTYSPVASRAKWKAQHPMHGNLPKVYELCADYHVPILLHIDPLDFPPYEPIQKLEEALKAYPATQFILAHANAYNNPENVRHFLENYNNIYMDFFAAFTLLNKESHFTLNDWVSLMKEYPDRFMLSTDSGYEVGLSQAYYAIYLTLDAINYNNISYKIAHENFMNLIQSKY